ncbi:MAG: GNAT family N-acetyltransferase [Luteimonas sp.]
MSPILRNAHAGDHAAILQLNLASEALLSPLDAARLAALDAQAAYHRVVEVDGAPVAFVLALREGRDYDSANYRWFAERYRRFVYVDRIAIAEAHRGKQLGRALYDDLFAFARASAVAVLTCEFYSVPFNEASSRFHARFGFREVGRQWLAGGDKQVSLQVATLPPQSSD